VAATTVLTEPFKTTFYGTKVKTYIITEGVASLAAFVGSLPDVAPGTFVPGMFVVPATLDDCGG
jgi:hypothetical protein